MGETEDEYRISTLFSCLEGEARSFVERNVYGSSRECHHWSFFLLLEIVEDHFINSHSAHLARNKIIALQQNSLSLASYVDKLTFWHSFLPAPSSDHDVAFRFFMGLKSEISNEMSTRGFTYLTYGFRRLLTEARKIEDSLETDKAARQQREHYRAKFAGSKLASSASDKFRPRRTVNRPRSSSRSSFRRWGKKSHSRSDDSRSPRRSSPSKTHSRPKDLGKLSSPRNHSRSLSEGPNEDGTCWNCGSDTHFKQDCPHISGDRDRKVGRGRDRDRTAKPLSPHVANTRSVQDIAHRSDDDNSEPAPE
jgi:hypothetical protein